jgi:hypothetical protein
MTANKTASKTKPNFKQGAALEDAEKPATNPKTIHIFFDFRSS